MQLTTDGHRPYLEAVEEKFGSEIDFAQLIKIYGASGEAQTRTIRANVSVSSARLSPDRPTPSTSLPALWSVKFYDENEHATLYSPDQRILEKARESHGSDCLAFQVLQFARIHQTTRHTPAMAAGVTSKLWDAEDIVSLLDSNLPTT